MPVMVKHYCRQATPIFPTCLRMFLVVRFSSTKLRHWIPRKSRAPASGRGSYEVIFSRVRQHFRRAVCAGTYQPAVCVSLRICR